MSSDTAQPQPSAQDTLFHLWQEKVQGANISSQTLLATDYLNHFNEIVMLIDMVPDMPELLDECRGWRPMGYVEHFQLSAFPDRELAIEAYEHVPREFLQPFEDTIEQMNGIVDQALRRMDEALSLGDPELLKVRAHASSRGLQRLMDVANAIIHGSSKVMAQNEIDEILAL